MSNKHITKENKRLAKNLGESLVGKLMEVSFDWDMGECSVCLIVDVTYSGDTGDFYLEFHNVERNRSHKVSFTYEDLYFLSIGKMIHDESNMHTDDYVLI